VNVISSCLDIILRWTAVEMVSSVQCFRASFTTSCSHDFAVSVSCRADGIIDKSSLWSDRLVGDPLKSEVKGQMLISRNALMSANLLPRRPVRYNSRLGIRLHVIAFHRMKAIRSINVRLVADQTVPFQPRRMSVSSSSPLELGGATKGPE
jgi:hypothetical protein